MEISALRQVRTMIYLHDWELGMFRFLSGQVNKYDSFTERDVNFCLKLQWPEMNLFSPMSIYLVIFPAHSFST